MTVIKINHLSANNPFILYSLSWIIVILLYQLGWSGLFPALSVSVLLFSLLTIFISGIVGVMFYFKKSFTYSPIQSINIKSFHKILIFLYILLIIEFISVRSIPLLGYLTGNATVQYVDFGLPIIHVIVVNGFSFYFLYIFHCIISKVNTKRKRLLLVFLLLAFLPSFLIMNRAIMMYQIFGATIIFLMSKQKVEKYLFQLGILGIGILFLFGAIGNLRTKNYGSENVILKLGEASSSFEQSFLPSEFFWAYMYICSPMANLQITINDPYLSSRNHEVNDFISFFVHSLTPQIISKRLEIPKNDPILIKKIFTVGTVYSKSFSNFGWIGMGITFLFMFWFIFVTLFFIPKNSPYFVTSLAIINTIIFFSIFDNMFTFMGIVPQLLIPIFFNFTHKLCKLK